MKIKQKQKYSNKFMNSQEAILILEKAEKHNTVVNENPINEFLSALFSCQI